MMTILAFAVGVLLTALTVLAVVVYRNHQATYKELDCAAAAVKALELRISGYLITINERLDNLSKVKPDELRLADLETKVSGLMLRSR